MKWCDVLILVVFCLSGCETTTPPAPADKSPTSMADQSATRGAEATSSEEGPTGSAQLNAHVELGPQPCNSARDCIVLQVGCCPPCQDLDGGGLPKWPVEVVNRTTYERHERLCSVKKLVCDACKKPGLNPNLIPSCRAGQCWMEDVSATAMSVCETDEDCHLRASSCCGCSGEPVAVSTSGLGLHKKKRCAAQGEELRCAPCKEPSYQGLSVSCVSGHCLKRARP